MKPGEYSALETAHLRETFMDYIDSIGIPLIDYMAIGVQNTIKGHTASLMSRPEWQRVFKETGLSSYDPVRKTAFGTKVTTFAFEDLDFQDQYGAEVMRQRQRYDIENGIVLMRRHLGYNYMLTLATGYKQFQPYTYLVDYIKPINGIFDDLISLIAPVTKEYECKIATRGQSVDAK